ncbi:hypothetical protein P8452_19204 [Trifolium repens]|nr:hypothetical protein P8452_19204 [Trifolium repens]
MQKKKNGDSFPFLQHLDLSFPGGGEGVSDGRDYDNAMNLLAQKLSKLRSVNLSAFQSALCISSRYQNGVNRYWTRSNTVRRGGFAFAPTILISFIRGRALKSILWDIASNHNAFSIIGLARAILACLVATYGSNMNVGVLHSCWHENLLFLD